MCLCVFHEGNWIIHWLHRDWKWSWYFLFHLALPHQKFQSPGLDTTTFRFAQKNLYFPENIRKEWRKEDCRGFLFVCLLGFLLFISINFILILLSTKIMQVKKYYIRLFQNPNNNLVSNLKQNPTTSELQRRTQPKVSLSPQLLPWLYHPSDSTSQWHFVTTHLDLSPQLSTDPGKG